ncbi:hypothetical protein L4X63_04440 [Geomonas sp. Red32]|uniref:hypothetical protein n=1 Tax=Geomonas sp. Red32 TaxID=2912856 RepID=UPI00202CEFA6|nr:hypothetical protein [Geomonas sp. Red32]MCM0080834.1 hypothetical protein [Geomonas sp. Red32]
MKYDPGCAPEPAEWLALDEQIRMKLVEDHHNSANITLPNVTLHAGFHVIVENRIAEANAPTVDAITRLMGAGVPRHDAVHAVASVLAEEINVLMKSKNPDAGKFEDKFATTVAQLNPKDWIQPGT